MAPNAKASTMPTTIVERSGVWCIAAPAWTAQFIHTLGRKSERKTVAQIAPVRDDSRDNASLRLGGDQHVELIELVHRDQLQDLDPHRAVGVAGQRGDK